MLKEGGSPVAVSLPMNVKSLLTEDCCCLDSHDMLTAELVFHNNTSRVTPSVVGGSADPSPLLLLLFRFLSERLVRAGQRDVEVGDWILICCNGWKSLNFLLLSAPCRFCFNFSGMWGQSSDVS